MIEFLIYWTGVIALLSAFSAVTFFCWWLLLKGLIKLVVNRLNSLYLHAQLYYFMGQIMNKGYAQVMKEVERKVHNTDK